jgi:hypothetical protein
LLTALLLAAATAARADGPASAPTSSPAAAPVVAPAAGPAPAAHESGPLRVAVYDLTLDGVNPTVGKVVSDSLLGEIRKLQGVSAIGMSEIRDMLSHEASKQLTGCEEDDSCLAEIGGALGVDELITGKLARVDNTHVISLRRLDQRRALVLGAFDQRLTADSGQEFLAALGPAVARLYPARPLRPGLKRGVADEVALRLDPPPLPSWSFWTAAGTTALVLTASGAAGLYWAMANADYEELLARSTREDVDGALLEQKGAAWTNAAIATWVLLGSGAALGMGTGLMSLFVDWWGYGDTLGDGEP